MIAAVEREVLPTGVPGRGAFEVRPDGVERRHGLQLPRHRRYRRRRRVAARPCATATSTLAGAPDVKFLVVSSDVIYPAGAMKDYEPKFYLPFKGFEKPIYAMPGNHDWYDALEAFAANFLEPEAARAAMTRASVEADHA